MTITGDHQIAEHWFNSDTAFNQVYPPEIQRLAKRHWTPLQIAQKAADFLATENNVRVLDIGSGAGKFCLAAAFYKPTASFTGVEQRKNLVNIAETARQILQLENASFINANFTQVDFSKYDHFYFYNAFYENLACTDKIDNSIDYSRELYNYYNMYLYKLLQQTPSGTKLAAYHSLEDEMPAGFRVVKTEMDSMLKFWIKL
jgi:SAM-dependent methyltransferase